MYWICNLWQNFWIHYYGLVIFALEIFAFVIFDVQNFRSTKTRKKLRYFQFISIQLFAIFTFVIFGNFEGPNVRKLRGQGYTNRYYQLKSCIYRFQPNYKKEHIKIINNSYSLFRFRLQDLVGFHLWILFDI